MKKLIIAVIAITTTVFANAQTGTETAKTPKTEITDASNPDRVKIKLEELPAAVRKSLTEDAFQGWTAKNAYIVKNKTEKPYYEVELWNTKSELNVVKFNEDGTVIK
jgi:hypothetical protein